jgi:hypothetical protein
MRQGGALPDSASQMRGGTPPVWREAGEGRLRPSAMVSEMAGVMVLSREVGKALRQDPRRQGWGGAVACSQGYGGGRAGVERRADVLQVGAMGGGN